MDKKLTRDQNKIFIGEFISSLSTEDKLNLGSNLIGYFQESEHTGFDGMTTHDVTGIYRFMVDFAIYVRNIEVHFDASNEIRQWNAGARITAVKGYRSKKGCSLQEAHDFFVSNPECIK